MKKTLLIIGLIGIMGLLAACEPADPITDTIYFTGLSATSVDAPVGRESTYIIAADNSLDHVKRQADYLCDGIADQDEINDAISSLASLGGSIYFAEGDYIVSEPIILRGKENITFYGCGYGSYIRSTDNVSWTVGADGADALFDTTGSDEITFYNLRININSTTTSAECIDADTASNMLVDRCYFEIEDEGFAVNFDGEAEIASENKFTRNIVETIDHGIMVMAKTGENYRTIIDGNIFKGWDNTTNGTTAIWIGNNGYAAYAGNVIITNNIIGNDTSFTFAGIYLQQCNDVIITHNHISVEPGAVGIRFADATRTLILGNNLENNVTPITANYLTIDPDAIVRDNMGYPDSTWWNLIQEDRIFTPSTGGGWLTGGSGSAIQWPTQLQARTSGVNVLCNEYIYTPAIGMGISQNIDWDEDLYFYTPTFMVIEADPTNEKCRLQWRQTTVFNAADAAEAAIGIEVSGANLDLIIESHDGVTRSELDTGINLTNARPYALEIVYLAGTGIYVYIDGELQGSAKTTNLPSGGGGASRWGISVVRSGGASTSGVDGPIISSPIYKSTYRP